MKPSHDDKIVQMPRREPGHLAVQEVEAAAALMASMREELKGKMSLFSFNGFFDPLTPVRLDDEYLTLCAPSTFHRDWVLDHYGDELNEVATEAAGHTVLVTVIYDPRLVQEPKPDPLPPTEPAPIAKVIPVRPKVSKPVMQRGQPLSQKYTFDDFIVGQSNQMAFAACRAVADKPADKYSPLFLFGGVGLGKTHLLQAIGNEARKNHPGIRVVYMSAEAWVNEYITDIRNRRFDDFRKKYRAGCDILLLDDIQFLAGKDASQDEFFHTFNSLYEMNRQIVVTADRYPHEIAGLAERLRTRLQWGLVADIQPPELETRIAILQTKAEALGMALLPEVAEFIAGQVRTSVRALEGALIRLSAYSAVTGGVIDLAQARQQLAGVMGKTRGLDLPQIMKTVSAYFDIRLSDLTGKSRKRQLTQARQIAMYIARRHLQASLPEIGRAFGRDHTTVLSSVRKIEGLVKSDAAIQAIIGRLERALLD